MQSGLMCKITVEVGQLFRSLKAVRMELLSREVLGFTLLKLHPEGRSVNTVLGGCGVFEDGGRVLMIFSVVITLSRRLQ